MNISSLCFLILCPSGTVVEAVERVPENTPGTNQGAVASVLCVAGPKSLLVWLNYGFHDASYDTNILIIIIMHNSKAPYELNIFEHSPCIPPTYRHKVLRFGMPWNWRIYSCGPKYGSAISNSIYGITSRFISIIIIYKGLQQNCTYYKLWAVASLCWIWF